MRYWVGITDNSWFDFLSHLQPDEVNFWQPSGKAPVANLESGAPFLFKLKKPDNHIAGGAFFVKFSSLPLSMVWDVFREKNGTDTRENFDAMIRRLSSNKTARDPYVGCTVLTEPFFWPRDQWIAAEPHWKSNVVVGAYSDSLPDKGSRLWAEVQARQRQPLVADESERERYGKPVLVRPRLGQSGFQVVVTDAYQRRCAITGERTLPALEAAHIQDYAKHGPHDIRNGLLLPRGLPQAVRRWARHNHSRADSRGKLEDQGGVVQRQGVLSVARPASRQRAYRREPASGARVSRLAQ